MALYEPDPQFEQAVKVMNEIRNKPFDKKTQEEFLMIYYIDRQDARLEESGKELSKYHEWFKALKSFLPLH